MRIPATFGHYRLDTPIGRGGMAEVFRAFDTRLKRPVAVKVMRTPQEGAHAQAIRRFLREARAASALNHPNIVIIHEVGETSEGEPFIVQEFIEGETLRTVLAERPPFDTALEYGLQIARALGAAHRIGIVHRDIKPENIMIRSDGFVKVLDFGLARYAEADTEIGDPNDETRTILHTAPGLVIGTPSYMSPEQASAQPSGPPADVFSFGVVLYEMAAGRRPFVSPSRVGLLAGILSEQPAPISTFNPEIPRTFDDLVLRMLEKSPEARPTVQDVERLLLALYEPPAAAPAVASPAPVKRTTVGRDDERGQLRRAYGRIRHGGGLMLAVAGEPGIGKTSLIEDFLGELAASAEPPIVARGRCSENLAGAEAYLPVLELLDHLLHKSARPAIEPIIRTVAPTWYVQVASQASADRLAGELRQFAPAASQERMKRELGTLVQEISRLHPLVLFIDDLHWADVSTIDLLNYLAGRLADARLLVLTSYRPSDLALGKHPFLNIRSDLQSRGVFAEIELRFLGPDDVARYLSVLFPDNAFAADLPALVHEKTEGSPLFMADLVRYLRDTGGIVEEHGTWMLARALPSGPSDLPESVRGMIARKIERLDENDRRLLQAASVQGQEFDSSVVAQALGLDAGEAEERLEVLERVHVFVKRGDEVEFPDKTPTLRYRFVHVLYQNVLFASLQPTRRAALSASIARSLVAHHRDETAAIAGRLAVLFETARDFAAAARYFYVAAGRAVSLFGFREALSLAERGLEGLRGLPEGPERLQLELPLQMIRGHALRSVKGWAAPELEATFARAQQVCQQLDNAPGLFPALWNLAFYHMIRGDLRAVRDETASLMALASESRQPAFVLAAHHLAGVTAEFMGDFVESTRLLERARELHVPAEHDRYTAAFGIDPGMVARAMSSRPLWALGFPDRAIARGHETIALGRSQRQPVTFVFALLVAQGIHVYRGEAAEAIALGDEIVGLCAEYEFPQEAEWARGFQGAAHALQGRVLKGVEQLRDSLAALHALDSGLTRTMFLSLYADALLRAGRVDAGHAAVEEGLAHAERTRELGFVAELHRVRGELLQRSGEPALAEQSLRLALDHAGGQQARAFELRAATALARLLIATGRAAEGRDALAPVYGWFTEGHDTADLVAARTTLSETG